MIRANDHHPLPQSHLINLLVQMREYQPSFTLFLGAGASIKSGVRSASSLVKEWREKYSAIHGVADVDASRKLNQPDEYSFLFESLFDHPSQRRNFIETCIAGAEPSWGYIYLVNLIHSKVLNTVFTTNFDDLLNEACFAYSSQVRPVVCAHDSSINNFRIFSSRPKIIKLHGDFLFDSIKNTEKETLALENNMREKFSQYANEFGMIVVGYSGNDRSVMDPLEKLLESDKAFPNGLYWCIRKDTELSRYVERLKRFPRFRIVEIEGFDEFCADLHNAIGLSMQPEVSDPYGALTQKLDGLMRKMNLPEAGSSHPVIERDVARLAEQLIMLAMSENARNDALPIDEVGLSKLSRNTTKIPVPFVFLATFFLRRGDAHLAHISAAAALLREPTLNAFDVAFKSLRLQWDETFGSFVMELLGRSLSIFDEPSCELTDFALEMLNAKRFDQAEVLLNLSDKASVSNDRFYEAISNLNHSQLYIHRGQAVPELLKKRASETLRDVTMPTVVRMGAAIIVEDWTAAVSYLQSVIQSSPWEGAKIPTWPIADLLIPHIESEPLRKTLEEIRKSHLGGILLPPAQAVHKISVCFRE